MYTQLVNAITRIGKVQVGDSVLRPIVGCSEQYRYRNKMTFTVSQGMVGEPQSTKTQASQDGSR